MQNGLASIFPVRWILNDQNFGPVLAAFYCRAWWTPADLVWIVCRWLELVERFNQLLFPSSLSPCPLPFPPDWKEKSVYHGSSSAARKRNNRAKFYFFLLCFWNDDQKFLNASLLWNHSTEVRSIAELLRCNNMLVKTCCSLQKQGLPVFRSDFCYL